MRSLLTSLFKDARTSVLVGVAVFAFAVLASLLKPIGYTASASLLVLGSDEYATRSSTLSQAPPPVSLMDREAILSSEMSILRSSPVIRATVDKLGVNKLYPDLEKDTTGGVLNNLQGSAPRPSLQDRATARFASRLQVKTDRSGSTIEVSFSHGEPDIASSAVNALIAAYHARRQSIYSSTESEVVETTVDRSREQLDKLSQQLAEFQASSGISNYETQMDLLLRRMSDQTRMLQAAETEAAELGRKIASLRQQQQSAPRDVVQYQESDSDRRVQRMRDSLADLRRQEADLLQTYTERSERVAAIRRQIEAMEQQVAAGGGSGAGQLTGIRRGINEVHTAIELELVRASSQANAIDQRRQGLSQQVASIQAEIQAMQAKGSRLQDLARQKLLAEQAFINVTQALQERRNREDLGARRAANVRTIEAADAPARPDRTRIVILLAGAFLSLVAAVSTALLLHRFRGTYLDALTLQRDTSLPVLGTITEVRKPLPTLGHRSSWG